MESVAWVGQKEKTNSYLDFRHFSEMLEPNKPEWNTGETRQGAALLNARRGRLPREGQLRHLHISRRSGSRMLAKSVMNTAVHEARRPGSASSGVTSVGCDD
jgi:hypothetical protein